MIQMYENGLSLGRSSQSWTAKTKTSITSTETIGPVLSITAGFHHPIMRGKNNGGLLTQTQKPSEVLTHLMTANVGV